jgi:hypothetical protein
MGHAGRNRTRVYASRTTKISSLSHATIRATVVTKSTPMTPHPTVTTSPVRRGRRAVTTDAYLCVGGRWLGERRLDPMCWTGPHRGRAEHRCDSMGIATRLAVSWVRSRECNEGDESGVGAEVSPDEGDETKPGLLDPGARILAMNLVDLI